MISINTRLKMRNIIHENKETFANYISNELHVQVSRYTDFGLVYKIDKSSMDKDFEHTSLYYLELIKPAVYNFFKDQNIVNNIINSLYSDKNKDYILMEIDKIINNRDIAMQLFNIKALTNNVIFISY